MSSDFDWTKIDADTVVVPSVRGIAVYKNEAGNVVIRQEAGPLDHDDAFVVIPLEFLPALVKSLQAAHEEF